MNRAVLILLLAVGSTNALAAKTLVYCSENNPSNFSPSRLNDAVAEQNVIQLFNTLVKLNLGTTDLAPDLAESWEISPDGLTYTFHLRKDVSFHKTAFFTPTRKLNADDVIFTMDRMRLKGNPYHMVGGGIYESFDSIGLGDIIQAIQRVDDYTVRFKLKHPEAPFLADMANPSFAITSKEYADTLLKKGTPEDRF